MLLNGVGDGDDGCDKSASSKSPTAADTSRVVVSAVAFPSGIVLFDGFIILKTEI